MGEKLKKIWRNKWKILDGIYRTLFPNKYIEDIATMRLKICQKDICGFYDELGVSEKAIFKGKPSCASCGCRLSWKTRNLSSACALEDLGLTPLWKDELSEKEEEKFRKRVGIKNEIDDSIPN